MLQLIIVAFFILNMGSLVVSKNPLFIMSAGAGNPPDCAVGSHMIFEMYTTTPICVWCATGSYWVDINMCKECPAGQYQPFQGQAVCLTCPPGTYSAAGASSCAPCPFGTINPNSGADSCVSCPIGSYASSSTSCALCPTNAHGLSVASACRKRSQNSFFKRAFHKGR